jgi:hypothetical protein
VNALDEVYGFVRYARDHNVRSVSVTAGYTTTRGMEDKLPNEPRCYFEHFKGTLTLCVCRLWVSIDV